MKKVNEDIRLSQQLFLYYKGDILEKEKEELEKKLAQDPMLAQWYKRFVEEGGIQRSWQEYDQIDLNAKWKHHIAKRRKKNLKKNIYRWSGWAAVFVILVASGWWIYFNVSNVQTTPVPLVHITPGSSKAELVTENGQRYILPEIKPGVINEEGTTIEHTKVQLNYQNEDVVSSAKKIAPLHTMIVPRGGEHQLTLADGTRIWLNCQSKLQYPAWFNDSTREVSLSGEAYFEVAHNETKPFFVNIQGVRLQVLGTAFNVKAYDDESIVETTLVSGNVNVSMIDRVCEQVVLKPGEQAVVRKNALAVRSVDVNQYISWKDGWFVFKEEPLQDMFQRLGRWYDFNVFFFNESIKNYPFTGTFKKEEKIEDVLKLLERTKRVRFKLNEKTILVEEQ